MQPLLFWVFPKKTTILYFMNGLFLSCLSLPSFSDPLIVNFQAVYSAATCSIKVPSSVSFNQGDYAAGVPSTAIQGDNIQQSFNISFTECSTSILPAIPKITVTGSTVTLNGMKLFSDNTGADGQAIGYGVKLSSPGNALFNSASNLAESNTLSATQGTSIPALNNQQLLIKAVLSCGADDCSNVTLRRGGTFTANVIFRLSYE